MADMNGTPLTEAQRAEAKVRAESVVADVGWGDPLVSRALLECIAAHDALLARVEALREALAAAVIRRGCSEWDEPFQKCGLCSAANDGDSPLNHAHDCPLTPAAPRADETAGTGGA